MAGVAPMADGETGTDLVPIQSQLPAGLMEVRRIKHGEVITEPGIYDMPMGWYHMSCCDGPSISSSGLRAIVLKTPLHYWDSSPLNPDRYVDEKKDGDAETAALRIGRAAHTLLLEPHLFKALYATRPGIYTSWQTKDSKKWRTEQQMQGITVLDPHEFQRVVSVASALRRHPLHERGIIDGDIERALIWKDAKSGVWLKSRPDVIPRGSNMFADLKVVHDASPKSIQKKIFEFGYDMQMALAGIGMWEILRREIEEFVVVAIESDRPHGIRIAPVAHKDISRARSLLRQGLNLFVECMEEGYWPSYDDQDNLYVGRSEYAAKQIDSAIEKGELPKGF